MSNETIFYIFGIGLAISAVLVSFAGLKLQDFPGRAMPVIVLWFAILVGGATTFAVLHAKDEDKEKSAKFEEAGKEIEKAESSGPFEQGGTEGEEGEEVVLFIYFWAIVSFGRISFAAIRWRSVRKIALHS